MFDQRIGLSVLCMVLFVCSCGDFYEDPFEISPPDEKQVLISFPGLVEFQINQSVSAEGEARNSFIISNELSQDINRLKFGINIFEDGNRFADNLVASYIDSITQPLGAFEATNEKVFNKIFSDTLKQNVVEVFIIEQDVLLNNLYSGMYIGEAYTYKTEDTMLSNIPFVEGFIDYKGDVTLRASGSGITAYNINGRMSSEGQFIGSAKETPETILASVLMGKQDSTLSIESDSLFMTLTTSGTTTIDSIQLKLTRNN